jgi:hypothetical protein
MRRRCFLIRVGGAAIGVPALVTLAGCGTEGAGNGAGDRGDAGGASFTVTNQDDADHEHELTIACADLAAGIAVTYVATGPHAHTVMLTGEEVAQVSGGESVTISFTDGHSHTFVISMPPQACPRQRRSRR